MKKNIYALLGIFAGLIAVAWLLMNRPGEQDVSSSNSQLLVTFDSASVDKIEIKSPANSVSLEKKGAEWFLSQPVDYRANQSNVTSLIHQSKNLAVKEIVSSNPEKRSIFQVDSAGTLVTIFQNGQQCASFIVGKLGQNYSETYVRKDQSNDVDIIDGPLSFTFKRGVKDWRDKTVFNIPKETITKISYQFPGESFSLSLRDSVWMIGDNKPKMSDVSSLLTSLSSIEADDFVDSVLAPAPKIAATISVGDVQLRFSESKNKDNYFVQTSNSPQWFELQGWRVKKLLKHKKDLME
ncbi:MAG: DUF4340 domain-containing protein [Bacteroidota bacterium]